MFYLKINFIRNAETNIFGVTQGNSLYNDAGKFVSSSSVNNRRKKKRNNTDSY